VFAKVALLLLLLFLSGSLLSVAMAEKVLAK
jgi:hypothetical protein